MCLEGHKETKKQNESRTYRRVRSFTHSFLFKQFIVLCDRKCQCFFLNLFRDNVKFLLFLYLQVQICNPRVPSSMKQSLLISETVVDDTQSQE